jgi:hypothetical protein
MLPRVAERPAIGLGAVVEGGEMSEARYSASGTPYAMQRREGSTDRELRASSGCVDIMTSAVYD